MAGEKEPRLFDEMDYTIHEIPIKDIRILPIQDRITHDQSSIDVLAQQIKEHGLHTEIWVNDDRDGGYALISGYRRLSAHKVIKKETIRAKVFNRPNDQLFLMKVMENIHRKNYDAYEMIKLHLDLIYLDYYDQNNSLRPIYTATQFATTLYKLLLKERQGYGTITKEERRAIRGIDKYIKKLGFYKSRREFENRLVLLDMDKRITGMLGAERVSMRTAILIHTKRTILDAEHFDRFVQELNGIAVTSGKPVSREDVKEVFLRLQSQQKKTDPPSFRAIDKKIRSIRRLDKVERDTWDSDSLQGYYKRLEELERYLEEQVEKLKVKDVQDEKSVVAA